jgi:hypothetical protein
MRHDFALALASLAFLGWLLVGWRLSRLPEGPERDLLFFKGLALTEFILIVGLAVGYL